MKNKSLLIFAATICLAPVSANAATNFITNGTFSANDGLFTTFFGYYGGIGTSTNPANATGWNHASNGGVNGGASGQTAFADNGANTGAVAFIQGAGILSQTVTIPVGTQLSLTFDYNSRNSTLGNIDLGVQLVFGGTPTVTNLFTATNVTPVGGSNPYTSSGTISFNAPANSFEVRFIGKNVVDDRTLLVDNVVLGAVPEPSAALLGALGAFALLRRKRTGR